MSIRLVEHIRDELRSSGAIQNTPEFCTGWLEKREGYIRTLRFRNRTFSLCDRPSHCTANAACTTVLGGAVAPLDRDLRNRDTAACCRVSGGYCGQQLWISGPGRLFASVS
jgi:hypothetical protein